MPAFATAADLSAALARYAAEARPGAFATPRYRLRYAAWGAGPAVVLVHGLGDVGRSLCLVMQRLADAGFTAVGYELADGLGDGAVLGRYKHADFAADLAALVDHLGRGPVCVCGSSFGSTVVLRALADYPDRFSRAAVQGGFARRPLNAVELGLCRLARYCGGRMGDAAFHAPLVARLERPAFAGADPEVLRFFVANAGRVAVRAAAHRGLALHRLDLRPLLPRVRQPLLMIGGDRDVVVWRALEAEVEAGVKDVRRVELSPCGHYPQYTLPGPMAAELIAFFR